MKLTLVNSSLLFWRRKSRVRRANVFDPFALTSELHLHGDFSDPSPLFRDLLKAVYKNAEKVEAECPFKGKNGLVKINYWKVRCPYCGEEFPYERKKPLRCPKCNNVIEKVDFRAWNESLEKFMNGEISSRELLDSPVVPTSEGYESLRESFLDPDIPKTGIDFGDGFDAVYKLFSPHQVFAILEVIKEIRKRDEEEVPLYALALLDFVSYNSMFSNFKDGEVFSMFYSRSPATERWAELGPEYFCESLERVARKMNERNAAPPTAVASYPFTLNLKVLYRTERFLYEWAKRALSLSDGRILLPRLFREHLFSCIDKECESFYEKDFEFFVSLGDFNRATFYLDFLDYGSLLFLVSLKDFRVVEVEAIGDVFRVELARGKSGSKPYWEIYSDVRKETPKGYFSALSKALTEFTRYEKVLGVGDEPSAVLKHVLKAVSEALGRRDVVGTHPPPLRQS